MWEKKGNNTPKLWDNYKRYNIHENAEREKDGKIFEATVTKNFPQVSIIENFP